jgi:hypothetical protein
MVGAMMESERPIASISPRLRRRCVVDPFRAAQNWPDEIFVESVIGEDYRICMA